MNNGAMRVLLAVGLIMAALYFSKNDQGQPLLLAWYQQLTHGSAPIITATKPTDTAYKWHDKNGNVHFSTLPPAGVNAEKIQVSPTDVTTMDSTLPRSTESAAATAAASPSGETANMSAAENSLAGMGATPIHSVRQMHSAMQQARQVENTLQEAKQRQDQEMEAQSR